MGGTAFSQHSGPSTWGARAQLQEKQIPRVPPAIQMWGKRGIRSHRAPPRSHPALAQPLLPTVDRALGQTALLQEGCYTRNHLGRGKYSARATNCDKLLALECEIGSQGFYLLLELEERGLRIQASGISVGMKQALSPSGKSGPRLESGPGKQTCLARPRAAGSKARVTVLS